MVTFEVGNAWFALDRDEVARVAPVPRLTRPPAAAEAFAGFMRFGAELIAVLRTHVILGLNGPPQPRLYDHLVLLRSVQPKTALSVDRVSDVINTDGLDWGPVEEGASHRDCIVAEFRSRGRTILSLDIHRLLSEFERERIGHFHEEEQRRRSVFGDTA